MSTEHLDRILIKDLSLRCIVGIYPEERMEKQDVVINIILHADYRRACQSDRIEDAVDYKKVKKKVVALVEESSFFLIERLAECIADLCLEDSRVRRVEVFLDKPGALRFARSVGVHITREQPADA